MCGENAFFRTVAILQCGSPPRVRGKRKIPPCADEIRRITPAHAGKTSRPSPPWRAPADHPRACGENFTRWTEAEDDTGSPPRMRGKQAQRFRALRKVRITPAHAGKTVLPYIILAPTEDHPRACGENTRQTRAGTCSTGSPPRMRGKPAMLPPTQPCRRITPAHAGKTLRKWRISVVDPSPQPQSSLTSRKADASSGSQRAPCAAPV